MMLMIMVMMITLSHQIVSHLMICGSTLMRLGRLRLAQEARSHLLRWVSPQLEGAFQRRREASQIVMTGPWGEQQQQGPAQQQQQQLHPGAHRLSGRLLGSPGLGSHRQLLAITQMEERL
jgi:hypothetical protein